MIKVEKELIGAGGVYCILNKATSHYYIGSSKNIYNRLHGHFCMLKKGQHHNTHFQNVLMSLIFLILHI